MFDKRLLGTWQSDRRRTFLHFKPKAGTSPQSLKKLKSLFGKLVIHWGRKTYDTELDGHYESTPYVVVANDWGSVVIRHRDRLTGEESLVQIHFDGDRYWIATHSIIEWFKKVK